MFWAVEMDNGSAILLTVLAVLVMIGLSFLFLYWIKKNIERQNERKKNF